MGILSLYSCCVRPRSGSADVLYSSRVSGVGSKSDQSSSIALNTMCVEDWAILGLETALAGVLTEHPAVS